MSDSSGVFSLDTKEEIQVYAPFLPQKRKLDSEALDLSIRPFLPPVNLPPNVEARQPGFLAPPNPQPTGSPQGNVGIPVNEGAKRVCRDNVCATCRPTNGRTAPARKQVRCNTKVLRREYFTNSSPNSNDMLGISERTGIPVNKIKSWWNRQEKRESEPPARSGYRNGVEDIQKVISKEDKICNWLGTTKRN